MKYGRGAALCVSAALLTTNAAGAGVDDPAPEAPSKSLPAVVLPDLTIGSVSGYASTAPTTELEPLDLSLGVRSLNGLRLITYELTDVSDPPGVDAKDRAALARLDGPVPLKFKDAPFEDVLKFIKSATRGPTGAGVPIHVDPDALKTAGVTMKTRVTVDSRKDEPLEESLGRLLESLGLSFKVEAGLLKVVAKPPAPRDKGAGSGR